MEEWRSGFYEAIKNFMVNQPYMSIPVKEVTGVTQDNSSPYSCDTCVDITYIATDDTTQVYSWYGDLGELISQL